MKRMRSFLSGRVFVLVLAAAAVLAIAHRRPAAGTPGPAASAVANPVPAPGPAAPSGDGATRSSTDALRQWIAEYRAALADPAGSARRAALLSTGAALARERRNRLLRLMREDPRQAVAEALRFDEYQALPAELRARVERPFSLAADFRYLPICVEGSSGPAPAADHLALLSLPDGADAAAFTYGRRLDLASKHALPVSGILLEGTAAVAEGVFREVGDDERVAVLAQFPAGQSDLSRSFATGRPLAGPGLLALAGGRVFAFSGRDELTRLDAALATLDDRPGPDAGSSLLLAALPAGADGGFDLPAAQALAVQLASAWTETRKKLFLIRVDFSDKTGSPVDRAEAAALLNSTSSNTIRAMSYGKTWIEAGVSASVYRLPQPASYYSGTASGSYNDPYYTSLYNELLRDARNVFRTGRTGADTACDIGPVSTTGTGGDAGLGDYDIVAITFAGIGMKAGGGIFSGLATLGAGDLWVQDANNPGLYVHEIGHNYGLLHASFWNPSGASPVGPGTSEEYGDRFDIMGSGPVERAHFQPQAKARLNWLTPAQWTDATAAGSGTYRAYRIDSADTLGSPRGIRVTKSETAETAEYYWIGYRPAFGDNPAFIRGASLNWQRLWATNCWLLDTTPGSAAGLADSPLALGRTFSDPAGSVHLTPVAIGGYGAEQYIDVRVNLGTSPFNHAPTVSGISGPATLYARTPAAYLATAADSDGDPMSYCWSSSDGLPADNSGAISRCWLVSGNYQLAVTVSDMKGGTAATQRSVTVVDPLDTWTTGTTPTTVDLMDVVRGQGRFVAANYWGQLLLSWDGQTWADVGTLPGFESQPHLACDDRRFVVAGKKSGAAAGQIGYSTDGRRWRVASFPDGTPQINAVAAGAGRFVAVTAGGAILYSDDGANWSGVTVAGLPDFRHVVWDGAAWLAVSVETGGSWPRRLWNSPDGVTWTKRGVFDFDVFGLSAAGGTAYALGWYAGVKCSVDHGLTWGDDTLPAGTQWTTHRLAEADDGTLLLSAQAMDEDGQPSAFLVSTNGRLWARAPGNATVAQATALAHGNGSFVAVGNSGTTWRSACLYPDNATPVVSTVTLPTAGSARQPARFAASATDPDGNTLYYYWDCGPQNPVFSGAELAPSLAFGGTFDVTLRVTDERGGLAVANRTLVVADPARTWTGRTSGVTANLTAVAASSSLLVAVGDNGTVLTSPNGANWTPRALPDPGGNLYLNAVTWDGVRFVIAGNDYDFGVPGWVGVIYTSPDGTTWTRRYKATTAGTSLRSVAGSGTVAVAAGDAGGVLSSTNGTTWTPVTIAGLGTGNVASVAWGGGDYSMVVGFPTATTVFASIDGLAWFDRSASSGLGAGQHFAKVAWLEDRFVASGWNSNFGVSTDFGQTFQIVRNRNEYLPALAAGDGIWLASGIDYADSNRAVDVLSLGGAEWASYPASTDTTRADAVFFQHTFVTVGAGGTIRQSGGVGPAGWAAWQAAHFPGGGLSALPERDPDGDGLPNRLEYALGRDPLVAAGADGPAALPVGVLPAGRLTLRIDLPEPAPADVVYAVQGSADLAAGTWTPLARKSGTAAWQWLGGGTSRITLAPPASGRVVIEVGRPDSTASAPRYFLRLVLEAP